MKNTWHFTLPKTLLLPETHKLAAQQGLPIVTSKNAQILLTLFQLFSAYSDLPLGMNVKQRQTLKQELQHIKHDPNSKISDVGALVRKIKQIKSDYHLRKKIAFEKQLSIFSVYESDDLMMVSTKVLEPISNYITQAKNELKHFKDPAKAKHPVPEFYEFVQRTETLLNEHRSSLAQSMLLRLQAADAQNDIHYDDVIHLLDPTADLSQTRRQLTRHHFMMFHTYIEAHGDKQTRAKLKDLSWLQSKTVTFDSILHPKQPRKPKWFFRKSHIMHQAFGDPYHQINLQLQIRRLTTIQPTEQHQLASVTRTCESLLKEKRRLQKLNHKLFIWIHSRERKQINERVTYLNSQCQQAIHLKEKMEKQISANKRKYIQNQKRRDAIQKRSQQYSQKIAELYFHKWIKSPQSIIFIDGNEYKADSRTRRQMLQSLSDRKKLQPALLKRMQTANPEDHTSLQELINELGSNETKALWHAYLDQYRLSCFRHILLDPQNTEAHFATFQKSLKMIQLPFPITDGAAIELKHLMQLLPLQTWTQHQHLACECIDSNVVLGKYYANIITHCLSFEYTPQPEIADAIIQRFAQEYLLEIEFPELKGKLETLIQRRLSEKESITTAMLIKSEFEEGQIDAAVSRLKQLQHDVKQASTSNQYRLSKQQLIAVTNTLTNDPNKPDIASETLIPQLRALLKTTSKNDQYLESLSQIQHQAEQLPYTNDTAAIKRLCNAGANIPHTITQLTHNIIAFANNECDCISSMDSLVLDIIEHDLITTQQKSSLLKVTEAVLLDTQKQLPKNELKRLTALRSVLTDKADGKDRAIFYQHSSNNPHRLHYRTTQSTQNHLGENNYEKLLRLT